MRVLQMENRELQKKLRRLANNIEKYDTRVIEECIREVYGNGRGNCSLASLVRRFAKHINTIPIDTLDNVKRYIDTIYVPDVRAKIRKFAKNLNTTECDFDVIGRIEHDIRRIMNSYTDNRTPFATLLRRFAKRDLPKDVLLEVSRDMC